jgi:hypothetical protein
MIVICASATAVATGVIITTKMASGGNAMMEVAVLLPSLPLPRCCRRAAHHRLAVAAAATLPFVFIVIILSVVIVVYLVVATPPFS